MKFIYLFNYIIYSTIILSCIAQDAGLETSTTNNNGLSELNTIISADSSIIATNEQIFTDLNHNTISTPLPIEFTNGDLTFWIEDGK